MLLNVCGGLQFWGEKGNYKNIKLGGPKGMHWILYINSGMLASSHGNEEVLYEEEGLPVL